MLFSVALAAACSDYEFTKMEVDPEPPSDTGVQPPWETDNPAPDILVDPLTLGFSGVCEPVSDTVTISNEGDAPLTLHRVALEGDGWSAPLDEVPGLLGPGDSARVELMTEGGVADLVIESDDPDEPVVTVPLDAARDELAPMVSIFSPDADDILGIDSQVYLTGQVDEDYTLAEDLSIEWSSSASGIIGTDAASSGGALSQLWSGERPAGEQTITVTATDACGNVGTDAVDVCQQAGFDVESLDIKTWNFEGSARWDSKNGWVELTAPYSYQAGTAFQTTSTVDSDDIEIEFSFFVSGGSGADGISLTALDSTRMTGFVGATGGGIGYAGMPGWSIEVDTWYNAENNDPTPADHISLHIDGNQGVYAVWSALPEMEDNAWHTMSVTVSGTHLTVLVDGVSYIDEDVPSLSTSFPAYIGFTGATGSATNYHRIDALKVTELVCEEPE